MNIKYLGHSSFLLKSKNAKIVTDPFDSSVVGLPFVGQEADIVTISHHHKDHDNLSKITGEPTVIDWPGEFEIKGVRIFGYRSYHDKQKGAERGEVVIYKYEIEDVSVAHCGDLGVIPDASLIDSIGNIDVLLVPVGGIYTIDAAEAVKLIRLTKKSLVSWQLYRIL
jgi:L-ascorbate metabolism protein UlaG (beta-lactamase superfamily)